MTYYYNNIFFILYTYEEGEDQREWHICVSCNHLYRCRSNTLDDVQTRLTTDVLYDFRANLISKYINLFNYACLNQANFFLPLS